MRWRRRAPLSAAEARGLRRNTPSYRGDASEDIRHHRADLVLPEPEPSGVAEPCRATIPEQFLPWADGGCSMLAKRRENGDTGPGVEFGLRRVEQAGASVGPKAGLAKVDVRTLVFEHRQPQALDEGVEALR